jgi:quercetin dioxygenase-like cupin family protein
MQCAVAALSVLAAATVAVGDDGSTDKLARIVRTPLITSRFPSPRTVAEARGVTIRFTPLQQTGRHIHPIPVIGYVVSGEVVLQVQGSAPQTIKAGEAFYEPADTLIERFDNPSRTEGATFVAIYLMGPGDTEVIRPAP